MVVSVCKKETQPLIEVRHLYRHFGEGDNQTTILNDINLSIASGEMVAIIGASGSGKSTLMNILGCLDTPSSGEYWFEGNKTNDFDLSQRARCRRESMGFVFQRYHLLSNLSAVDNVMIPSIYSGVKYVEGKQRAETLLARLGLAQRINYKPTQLSGGQQQRVSIARALMNGGKVIFADEPTGALDSQSSAEVIQILRELHALGHTVILVTHDLEIAHSADRIIELKDGKIIADTVVRKTSEVRTKTQPLASSVHERFSLGRYLSAFMMALNAILTHKLRAFLTMLGIIIGISSVVSVVAIGHGAQQHVLDGISQLGTNTIEIFPGRAGDRRAWRTKTLTSEDAYFLAQQDFIESATPSVFATASLRYGIHDLQAEIEGVGEQYFQVRNQKKRIGRLLNIFDMRENNPVAIIDESSAKQLFHEQNPIGEIIILNNLAVKIVGVVADDERRRSSSQSINLWLPYSVVMDRLSGQSYVNRITVRVVDTIESHVVEDAITRVLIRRHGTQDFSLFNADSLRQTIESTTKTLSLLISSIAFISLLVGGIGVMNIMLVSVTERTQEIGIRMAMGARYSDIMLQFLIEAVVLCFIGGGLGILFAFSIGYLVSLSEINFKLIYSSTSIMIAFLCSTGIGLLFGYLPARNAARLDPIQALVRE